MTGNPSSDIAFSPRVKALQEQRGSRSAYARIEARGGFRTAITPDLVAFLAEVDTAFLATSNAEGQPYAQHRGGPAGFIRALDEHTLGFADFSGNRQYITAGNLEENDRAFLFLIDYAHRRRVKLWGRARVVGLPSCRVAHARALQRATGAGDPVHRGGMGHQLSAAHPAQGGRGCCRGSARAARSRT